MSDFRTAVVYHVLNKIFLRIMNFKRTRFLSTVLLASPSVLFVYSPILVGLTLVGVATPFATGRLIDELAYHRAPYGSFAVLTLLLLLRGILTPVLQRFISSRSRNIEADLQSRVLSATMKLSPSQLAEMQNGELVAKLSRDTFAIGGFVRGLYPRLLQAVTMMFAAGFALFARSSVLALSFMAFFPLAVLMFAPFARRFAANSHRVRQQGDVSFTSLLEFLATLPLLRILDAELRFADAPRDALRALKEGNDETDAISVWFGFLLGILLILGEIAVLGFAGALAAKGTIPIGDVVLYQMLFITAIQSVQGVISLLPDLAAIREGADSLGEALNRIPSGYGQVRIDKLTTLEFRNVTFAYPHAPKHPIVRNFTAVFSSGTIVGLSGANGAGKTTLLKLAVNALEPQTGEVLVNGRRFNEIDLPAFRRRIGVVFQDDILVTGTVRDNITLRDPAYTQKDIDRALALSGFDTVVKRLPEGLDTHVGNTLRNLSGGERQRLAIARAVIRDPLILILDEATNHLDAESRKILTDLVSRLRPGRAILIAGHDPELNKLCAMKIFCQN